MTPIVFITGRYQLGDQPGIFQDAIYVGHQLILPFRKTWIDATAKEICLNFYTHDVETWGVWLGHKVSINDVEIGRLKDDKDKQGTNEHFQLRIPRTTLEGALKGDDQFTLTITLETQPAMPGLADDFVLWRIESDGTFAAIPGWK